MKRFITAITIGLVLATFSASPAQQQNKNQQACINKVVKSARKVSGAVLKDAAFCIKRAKVGALPMGMSAQDCLSADIKGKVGKARAKVAKAFDKSCGTAPDFAFTDATTTGDAYVTDNLGTSTDSFQTDLDATLTASDGVDPSGKCSSTLPTNLRKLEDALHKEMESCIKTGLKNGSITSVIGIETCFTTILADTKGKIGKAVGTVQKLLTNKCPAGNLDTIFPGLTGICGTYLEGTDAAGIAACERLRLKCRLCRIFNDAYGLDQECDVYDDGSANGSCPECGNTVTDPGEQCDDGNTIDGDGCADGCIDEFCGDGVINDNGAEVCDDGAGNSDTDPDACRTDCTPSSCGDGVTDSGEECDDGNTVEDDGCTTSCTSCGNGMASGPEQCDDGNNDDGDCCSAACLYESYGNSCTGPPSGDCTAPGCDGAGTCAELPANEGVSCDDGDECSISSTCQTGECTATSFGVLGSACRWMVVGKSGMDADHRVDVGNSATSTGDWCGNSGRFGSSSTTNGVIVTTSSNTSGNGVEFNSSHVIGSNDVVTNNFPVVGLSGATLPGMPMGTSLISPGQLVAHMGGGSYDTTGTDTRIDDCEDAQTALAATAGLLDALPQTADLATTLQSVSGGTMMSPTVVTINAVNVGGLNVFDIDSLSGGTYVTVNLDGGGDADTVFIFRSDGVIDSNQNWVFNLNSGLTSDHLLWYGKASGGTKCQFGFNNIGGGTVYCPDTRIQLAQGTQWDGALFGGGASNISTAIGDNVVLTHSRFTGQ